MKAIEAQGKAKVIMAWELLYEALTADRLPDDIACAVSAALTELDEELIAAGWVENFLDDMAA